MQTLIVMRLIIQVRTGPEISTVYLNAARTGSFSPKWSFATVEIFRQTRVVKELI